MDELIRGLRSPSPQIRCRTLSQVGDRHEPELGHALVEALLHEEYPWVWWQIANRVLPIWIPILDQRLAGLPTWPFCGGRTLDLLRYTRGHQLCCMQPHIDRWLAHPEWTFRFAAFRWLAMSGQVQRTCVVAHALLARLDESFEVSQEARQETWNVEAFANEARRREELWRFIVAHDVCEPLPPASSPRDALGRTVDGVAGLNSSERLVRIRSLWLLRHRREPAVGEALVRALILEQVPEVWWLSVICVLPTWLPLLDRRLAELPAWPFSGARTLRVLQLARGHVLASARRYVGEWLAHQEWEFRFAAFRWLAVGGSMEEADSAATALLNHLDESFEVNDQSLNDCSWMAGFDNAMARRAELAAYRECGELICVPAEGLGDGA